MLELTKPALLPAAHVAPKRLFGGGFRLRAWAAGAACSCERWTALWNPVWFSQARNQVRLRLWRGGAQRRSKGMWGRPHRRFARTAHAAARDEKPGAAIHAAKKAQRILFAQKPKAGTPCGAPAFLFNSVFRDLDVARKADQRGIPHSRCMRLHRCVRPHKRAPFFAVKPEHFRALLGGMRRSRCTFRQRGSSCSKYLLSVRVRGGVLEP